MQVQGGALTMWSRLDHARARNYAERLASVPTVATKDMKFYMHRGKPIFIPQFTLYDYFAYFVFIDDRYIEAIFCAVVLNRVCFRLMVQSSARIYIRGPCVPHHTQGFHYDGGRCRGPGCNMWPTDKPYDNTLTLAKLYTSTLEDHRKFTGPPGVGRRLRYEDLIAQSNNDCEEDCTVCNQLCL